MLADQMVAAVTTPPARTDNLEALIRRLLPTTPVPTLPPSRYPQSWNLLQHLLPGALATAPAPPPKTGVADMETLLQRLLPGTPGPVRRDWAMACVFLMWKIGSWDGRRRRWEAAI